MTKKTMPTIIRRRNIDGIVEETRISGDDTQAHSYDINTKQNTDLARSYAQRKHNYDTHSGIEGQIKKDLRIPFYEEIKIRVVEISTTGSYFKKNDEYRTIKEDSALKKLNRYFKK